MSGGGISFKALPVSHATLEGDVAAVTKALRKRPAVAAAFGRLCGTITELARNGERVMRSQEAALATSGALQARCEDLQAQLRLVTEARDRLAEKIAKSKRANRRRVS